MCTEGKSQLSFTNTHTCVLHMDKDMCLSLMSWYYPYLIIKWNVNVLELQRILVSSLFEALQEESFGVWIEQSRKVDRFVKFRYIYTMRPRQNGPHFADIFNSIFLNENVCIPIKISLKFVPKGPINNIPLLVQIMAWRRSGDKPLSEPMVTNSLTHLCVTQAQWVNHWHTK